MQTVHPTNANLVTAPDSSEIRELAKTDRGSMVHCTLPPGATSLAVAHRTCDEVWYFLSGRGELWRKSGAVESVVEVGPGMSVSIEIGVRFQFRNTGDVGLCFIITTIPPWPGNDEAYRVPGHWPT